MTTPLPQSFEGNNLVDARSCGCTNSDSVASVSRRSALLGILALLSARGRTFAKAELPLEVAGILLPNTPATAAAARYARDTCPDFLFNHCMRTFLFGAVAMTHHKVDYSFEDAFIAATLHDLGLVQKLASADRSFEMDGANLAAQFARANGIKAGDSEEIWWAVALHDGRFSMAEHRGGVAMLVSMGAGSDVIGPDADMIDSKRTAEIVAAFPRLGFKNRFSALLTEHCRRKPLSQKGTWLESLCREQVPSAHTETTQKQIHDAPFEE